MKKYLKFENVSTVLNSILLSVFGLLLGYLASKGLNLPITAETLTSIGTGLILLIFSYYNAKNQNTLFDEEKDTIYFNVDDLNEQQVRAINNFIEKCVNESLKKNNKINQAGVYENDSQENYIENSSDDEL